MNDNQRQDELSIEQSKNNKKFSNNRQSKQKRKQSSSKRLNDPSKLNEKLQQLDEAYKLNPNDLILKQFNHFKVPTPGVDQFYRSAYEDSLKKVGEKYKFTFEFLFDPSNSQILNDL
jgi:hypothetical protein